MARLFIHPRYREWLHRLGLRAAEDFLRLSGVIVCGHPDRHVARITLADGGRAISLFLKKEHRVRLRDRLANLLGGFGFVSKTYKERTLLAELARRRIASPQVIAAGESGGQAFLLARDMERATDLRRFLQENQSPRMRRQLARQLGAELARIHQSGLAHRDLYAKHVLVEPRGDGFTFHFLDWQRSRLVGNVSWGQRCRDLATLHATLADELATPRERLAGLIAYVRACSSQVILPQDRSYLASTIRAAARMLLRKRHIRELLQPPLPIAQNLIWLDGEALCVTKEFRDELGGEVPAWLPRLKSADAQDTGIVETIVTLPCGGSARMILRRTTGRLFRWLWQLLARRPLPSPELDRAATVFRLQRHGVALPRVLAVGQCRQRLGQSCSFLLTEEAALLPLGEWLHQTNGRQRRRVVVQVADQLRRIHDAGYHFHASSDLVNAFGVGGALEEPAICLRSTRELSRGCAPSRQRALNDLRRLFAQTRLQISRAEARRFLKEYLARLSAQMSRALAQAEARAWARDILAAPFHRQRSPRREGVLSA